VTALAVLGVEFGLSGRRRPGPPHGFDAATVERLAAAFLAGLILAAGADRLDPTSRPYFRT
jgi:hypothetical protein